MLNKKKTSLLKPLVFFYLSVLSHPLFAQISTSDGNVATVTVVGHRDTVKRDAAHEHTAIHVFTTPVYVRSPRPRSSSTENNADIRDECQNPVTKNPVVIATGEKYKDETDFKAPNPYSLSMSRTYRSKFAKGSWFGPNWMSNLDVPSLTYNSALCNTYANGECVPRTVTVTGVSGAPTVYTLALNEVEHVYEYSTKDGSTVTYQYGQRWILGKDTHSFTYSSGGRINSVVDSILGNTLSYEYGAGGLLKSITSTSGHKVQFAWSGDRVSQVIDPQNGVWTYTYNSNKMLEKVVSPGGAEWREYHYEDANPMFLTGISINGVRYSTYLYDSSGRVRESGLTGGEEVDKFAYSTNSTSVTDARGQVTNYTFADIAGSKKVVEVSSPGSATCTARAAKTFYDANGYVDYTLDWNGNRTDFQFDGEGKLVQRITAAGTADAAGETYTWLYGNVNQIDYSGADGQVYLRKNLQHDVQNRVTSESLTDVATGIVRRTDYVYSFHPSGIIATQTISVQLGGGEVASTLSNYDTAGNLTSVTNPMQHTSSWFSHDGFGNAQTYIDPNNVPTSFAYNAWGGVRTITDQNGNVTVLAYTPSRQIESVTYPDGRSEKYRYNAAGRLIHAGNARDEYVHFDPNVPANSSRTSSPRHVPGLSGSTPVAAPDGEFSATEIVDLLGRPYTLSGNSGQRKEIRYDANGNIKSVTDAGGRATLYDYDGQNRAVKIAAADGGVIRKTYDNHGNLEVVTDSRGLQTIYTYDGFGAVKTIKSPETGLTVYDYDAAGRLVRVGTADNKSTSLGWDKLGRRISRCSGNECHTYTYDGGSYGKGRLTRIDDWTGNTSYDYNSFGQLINQTNNIYGQMFTTTWGYDRLGKLTTMTYPTGLVLTYEYDGFGRRSAVKSTTPLRTKN